VTDILFNVGIWSLLDVLLLAFIIYQLLLLMSGTRAAQMLTGIGLLGLLFIISAVFPLNAVHWTMNKFYSSFIIIMIILFQDDIRHVLSRLGKRPFVPGGEYGSSAAAIDELSRATKSLSERRIGALLVIEQNINLDRYVEVGIEVDTAIKKEILVSFFQTSSPIHDGAAVIRGGRIAAAGVFLPLSKDEALDPNLGTRHRAAIGMSQETDAIVIVVSEEHGGITIVKDGVLSRRLDGKGLRAELQEILLTEKEYQVAQQENRVFEQNPFFEKIKDILKADHGDG